MTRIPALGRDAMDDDQKEIFDQPGALRSSHVPASRVFID